jgi:phytoene dehydrogenase-like protein
MSAENSDRVAAGAPAPSVGIIGAGIAGLSTGCYAQMNGYRAHIYEMHNKPGGLCTSWKRDGYTFDCCIHWLTGSRPGISLYKLWQEVGLIQGLQLIDHDEAGRVEFPDGPTVTMFTDLDRLERHLIEIAPEDAAPLRDFLGDARRLAHADLPSDLPPRQLMGLRDMLRMAGPMMRIMRPYRTWVSVSIAEFLERLKNPFVRTALGEVWIPEMTAFFLLMTLAWFHGRQAGYPIGGSLPLARAIERRFGDLGGEIDYHARISEILVENGRAVGLRLEDGREERFDVIVSAADAHATIFDMLHGRYADDEVRGWFTDLTPFPALVFVGVGVDQDFSAEPRMMSGLSLALEEPVRIGERSVDRFTLRIHNYDPTLAPAGKTALTCMFGADYDYWKRLAEDRPAYEAEKQAIGATVVQALDRRFPGLAERVEVVDVSTPTTFERYTGNWRGSFEGWLPTPKAAMLDMRKTLPGLGCFYMAGQWVSPGGGIPAGVITGRQVVQLMCHEDGRRFRTAMP